MANYYLKDDGIITESAKFKFNENCLETEEEIVRRDDGILVLKSEYQSYILTEEYKAKQMAKQSADVKATLQAKIDTFDLKCIRALREGGIYDSESGQTWLQYYQEQIVDLRNQIANL